METREPKIFRRPIVLTDQEKATKALRAAQIGMANRRTKPTKAQQKESRRDRKSKAFFARQADGVIRRAKPVAKPRPVALREIPPYRSGMGVEFYDTREWQELRYRALAKYGPTCHCCGARRAEGAQIHIDHIKPRSRYPALELVFENLQILCRPCNIGKSNTDETDWR